MNEPKALAAGVEPDVIDVIRHDHPLMGLDERTPPSSHSAASSSARSTTSARRPTRARSRRTASRTWWTSSGLMGVHAADAAVLAAFDQHLPAGVEPLLPLD